MYKRQDVRWWSFRWSIPRSIDYARNSRIGKAISNPSCSYSYEIAVAKITARICQISHCLAWFDTIEFNSLPCPNDMTCDREVFADRIRNQLTKFEMRILIGISRPFHDQIVYEIVISKITTSTMRDLGNDLPYRTILCNVTTLLCSYCIWNSCCQNHRKNLPYFKYFCMNWYGWVQSPAV